jgi:hypothetical protein
MTVGAVSAAGIARWPAFAAPAAAAANAGSLHALAAAKGMRFGSTVNDGPQGSFRDPNYARLLETDCGLVAAQGPHRLVLSPQFPHRSWPPPAF